MAFGYEALLGGCSHMINTSKPSALLKRGVVLVADFRWHNHEGRETSRQCCALGCSMRPSCCGSRERVLAAVWHTTDGSHTRLVFAGRP